MPVPSVVVELSVCGLAPLLFRNRFVGGENSESLSTSGVEGEYIELELSDEGVDAVGDRGAGGTEKMEGPGSCSQPCRRKSAGCRGSVFVVGMLWRRA